jgi:hypothetical protein
MTTLRVALVTAFLAMTLGATVARATPETDVGFAGWGPRIGASLEPDQIFFGVHLDYGNFGRHVRFQPNLELGLGDHVKLFTLNAEIVYRLNSTWEAWSPYLGLGIGANIKSVDSDGSNNSQTDMGINLIGGFEKGFYSGNRFFVETKISVNDVPDIKVAIGWTFF